jgi:sialidase-1
MIQCAATGLVFSNPKPYLKAVHAWHPSIVRLSDSELLCAFDLGQAAESLDYRTYTASSLDGGLTWQPPVRLFHDPAARPSTHTVRISRLRDGTLVGLGARFYRDDPERGLTNRATLGFVPLDLILLRSNDAGKTWTGPEVLEPPLVGPAFEVCHAVVELADGRWLVPTQTWPNWEGRSPHGMKAIALVSPDKGQTWPEYVPTFNGDDRGVIHFEQSMVQLADGRLLAVAWAYDRETRKTLSTPYAVSEDGRSFAEAKLTGLSGQTAKLLALDDGRFLCVYRRDDKPGLWAQLARLEGDQWINLEELLLWQGDSAARATTNTSDALSSLKFGFPSLVRLNSDEAMVVFWCEENGVHNIRWFQVSTAPKSAHRPHFSARTPAERRASSS